MCGAVLRGDVLEEVALCWYPCAADPLLISPHQKKSKLHYHIAVIINYLGHCVSLGALLVAFVLFMRLR